MATIQEITEVLTRLIAAYPTSKIDDKAETIRVYADSLEEIPGYVLEEAAEQCIKTMKWLPSISKLRKVCAKKAGIGVDWMGRYSEGSWEGADQEKPSPYNTVLDKEYIELVRIYCQTPRQFDEARWLRLIRQLKFMKRKFKAEEVQKKFDAFKWTVENEHTPMVAEESA